MKRSFGSSLAKHQDALRIVGIDPGSHRIGYALISGNRADISLLRTETITIPPKTPAPESLSILAQTLDNYLEHDRPDVVSLEKLFFSKNVKTALSVAEARGVILLTATRHVRSIWEYTPLEVKMALVGYGKADKRDIMRMVKLSMPHHVLPQGDDAIDAIAIAITAIYQAPR